MPFMGQEVYFKAVTLSRLSGTSSIRAPPVALQRVVRRRQHLCRLQKKLLFHSLIRNSIAPHLGAIALWGLTRQN